MPYQSEKSNPFGVDDFLSQIEDIDIEKLKEIVNIKEELEASLSPKDKRQIPAYTSNRKLISVAVDGGNQVAFRFVREMSIGLVRVSASSNDLEEKLEPFTCSIKNFEIFPVSIDGQFTQQAINKHKTGVTNFLKHLFRTEIGKTFSNATKISSEDLGETIFGNMQAFTNSIRDLLEWAYIVSIVERFKGIRILIVKDGRLEQHGVENTFVTKLRTYFESRNAYVVGVLKGTKLLREGLSSWIIYEWIKQEKNPFFIKVPDKLMQYVYGFEKQWNPEFDKSYVFGNRYVTKLYTESFHPLESVISFDVPAYIDNPDKVEEVVATLHDAKSVLFGGSLTVVQDAHAQASVAKTILDQLEQEIEKRLKVKLDFREWGNV